VLGLVHSFDHSVSLNTEEHITVLVGPNGVGKTMLLKIIDAFFNRQLSRLYALPFTQILLGFSDNITVKIESPKTVTETWAKAHPDEVLPPPAIRFSYQKNGSDERLAWEYRPVRRHVRPEEVKRYLEYDRKRPGVPSVYINSKTGHEATYTELARRYREIFPASRGQEPEWLLEIIQSINCRFIQTQRLLNISADSEPTPVVEQDAEDLAEAIQSAYTKYAITSQTLDQTFPRRVLLLQSTLPESEAALRRQLNDLDVQRAKLTEAGLLGQAEGASLEIDEKNWDESIRRVIHIYIDDTRQKFETLRPIHEKISAFIEILKSKFRYKGIKASRENGISITSERGEEIKLSSLSSGEQHQLVLLYELLFKTQDGTLLLIDEPELSLHVAWQKRVIPDLERVIELNKLDVVLATHSPQIINDRWDLTIELGGTTDVR
jgi:ABC-type Mn2+/Zn2+ transport system ATPase subunit